MEVLFVISAGVLIFHCGIMAERHKELAYETKPILLPKARKVRMLRKVAV